jgi:hypothetical protein
MTLGDHCGNRPRAGFAQSGIRNLIPSVDDFPFHKAKLLSRFFRHGVDELFFDGMEAGGVDAVGVIMTVFANVIVLAKDPFALARVCNGVVFKRLFADRIEERYLKYSEAVGP